ncbi:MAG TPA: hypothetical protein VHV49_13510 [Pseudonocardiaceae bacterium]|nr:hypothetical protein [Pseudonocardiaceae bacterium]
MLGHTEHGDDLVGSDDLDLGDQGIDQGLGLGWLVAVDDLIDVGDDLGEFGGCGHGGFAVEFLGQLIPALPQLLDLGGQGVQAGCGGFLAHGAVLERDEVAVHSGVGLGQLGVDRCAFGEAFGVPGGVEGLGVGDCFGDQVGVVGVEIAQRGEHGPVQVVGVEPGCGAFGAAVAGAGEAGVVAVGLGAAVRGGADHGLAAVGAAQFAGEQVVRGVRRAAGVVFAACGQDLLRHLESLGIDDRLVGVGYDDVAEGDLTEVGAVDQHAQYLVGRPGAAGGGAVAALVESVGDRAGADAFVGVAGEDRADDGCFCGCDLEYGGVRVWGVAAGP